MTAWLIPPVAAVALLPIVLMVVLPSISSPTGSFAFASASPRLRALLSTDNGATWQPRPALSLPLTTTGVLLRLTRSANPVDDRKTCKRHDGLGVAENDGDDLSSTTAVIELPACALAVPDVTLMVHAWMRHDDMMPFGLSWDSEACQGDAVTRLAEIASGDATGTSWQNTNSDDGVAIRLHSIHRPAPQWLPYVRRISGDGSASANSANASGRASRKSSRLWRFFEQYGLYIMVFIGVAMGQGIRQGLAELHAEEEREQMERQRQRERVARVRHQGPGAGTGVGVMRGGRRQRRDGEGVMDRSGGMSHKLLFSPQQSRDTVLRARQGSKSKRKGNSALDS